MAIWPEAPGSEARSRDGDSAKLADRPDGGPFIPRPGSGQPRRGGRGGWRRRLALIGLAAALAGMVASLAGVVVQLLPRQFTAAQQHQITAWEVSARWRAWPAARIFPAAVPYRLSSATLASVNGLGLVAHRTGIAPQSACRHATDPAVGVVLAAHNCLAVLRATYRDATGSMAVAVGVAVFPDAPAAAAAYRGLPPGVLRGGSRVVAGVRPVRFPGTMTAAFGPRQRQLTWASRSGPYLVLAAGGYADGRPRVTVSKDQYTLAEMSGVTEGVAGSVSDSLWAAPPAPHCPGTPGC